MKKRWIGFALVCLMLIAMFSACGENEESKEDNGTVVYYLNLDKTKVVPERYDMKSNTQEGKIQELLDTLQKKTSGAEKTQAIPEKVTVMNSMVNGYLLTVDFSTDYLSLETKEEVLTRAAVVKTLMQVEGISYISFTVDGQPLVSENGVLIGRMNEESFVENPGKQIIGSQERILRLYFSNAEGTMLKVENRKVRASSNVSMEKLIVEQLIEGTKSADARSTLPSDSKIITISVNEGVCYVNLDEAVVNQNTDVSEDVILYSIVNSLTELDTVQKVQILINGDTTGKLRFVYDLSAMYEANMDWVEKEE